ncbi:putative phosphatase [Clostridia bacterium]|nr:putative phosphatase [Clostridia bacterium]
MKILTDLHCHTIASSHGYSTVREYADAASARGLEAIAITDHAPGVTDGAHIYHFSNISAIPRVIYGVNILYGAECTMQDSDGNLDLPVHVLEGLDVVIASIHQSAYQPRTPKEHTAVLLSVMDHPCVNVMGHLGREQAEFDIDRVVKKAKDRGILIELNAASLRKYSFASKRCAEIATACKKHGVPVTLSSDSHYAGDIGKLDDAIALAKEVGIDERLIMNLTYEKIADFLKLSI